MNSKPRRTRSSQRWHTEFERIDLINFNVLKSEERIVIDKSVMLGKPTIKGTRITVELIQKLISEGATIDDLVDMYPHLSREDIEAAMKLKLKS